MTSCLKWENFSKDPANSTYHYSKLAKIVIEDRVNKREIQSVTIARDEEMVEEPLIDFAGLSDFETTLNGFDNEDLIKEMSESNISEFKYTFQKNA
ncbi:8807_t:CDS:2 [Entrophospora sp. SA101]|nr:8807_t:CDS:2 [Entrophospora sp. SA101]CAJ0897511.1 4269_t:CDS:2 [Entrophospora sp. SA101]CAJ0897547.1 4273_t:CDS:2 [Entrophospora sp. SA101]CAJ0897556.1 4274_t:CDS:2 [Entrophospora sp. SA101]